MKNTSKKARRVLAMFLAMMMCLSMLNLTAFAEESAGGNTAASEPAQAATDGAPSTAVTDTPVTNETPATQPTEAPKPAETAAPTAAPTAEGTAAPAPSASAAPSAAATETPAGEPTLAPSAQPTQQPADEGSDDAPDGAAPDAGTPGADEEKPADHKHTWENGKCTTEGCGAVCEHKYDAQNPDGKCTVCGAECEHDYNTDEPDGKCTVCGAECEHQYNTEEPDGKCTVCGAECEHKYKTEEPDGKCTVCGLDRAEVEEAEPTAAPEPSDGDVDVDSTLDGVKDKITPPPGYVETPPGSGIWVSEKTEVVGSKTVTTINRWTVEERTDENGNKIFVAVNTSETITTVGTVIDQEKLSNGAVPEVQWTDGDPAPEEQPLDQDGNGVQILPKTNGGYWPVYIYRVVYDKDSNTKITYETFLRKFGNGTANFVSATKYVETLETTNHTCKVITKKSRPKGIGRLFSFPDSAGELGEHHQLEIVKRAILPGAGEFDILGPFDNLLEHFVLGLRGGQGGVDLKQLFDLWDDVFPAGGAGLVLHQFGSQSLRALLGGADTL